MKATNKEIQISQIETLYKDIVSVISGNRAGNRFAVADVYEFTISAESYFPKKPFSLSNKVPYFLRRKISNSCSSCVKPSVMENKVQEAKRTLNEYRLKLKKYLAEEGIHFEDKEIKKSVHELKPNILND